MQPPTRPSAPPPRAASATRAHTYADGPATRTVTVKVTDKDGGFNSATFTVTVNNVAPTVTPAANQSANEGASTSFTLGSFSDPGVNDNPWAVDVDWGDATAHTTFSSATQGSLGSQSHTYADGPATRTVTVKVTDKDGGIGTNTFTVTVSNVAPTVGPITFTFDPFSGVLGATANFTDPAGALDRPYSTSFTWTVTPSAIYIVTPPTVDQMAQSVSGSINLPPGCYTVTLTINVYDKDGGVGTRTATYNGAPTRTSLSSRHRSRTTSETFPRPAT